ncbi:diguanylate cyclase/phosphodiesterase (GGDEF & EAL domains) with PAS/PAC sensor(s), partial [hydrothermal vent metagenome]
MAMGKNWTEKPAVKENRKTGRLLAGFGAFVILTGAAQAGPALDNCASQAASPFESGYEDIGVTLRDMNLPNAISACDIAVSQEPEAIQAHAWLGRALWNDNQPERAFEHLRFAAEAGNLLAMTTLGNMLIDGDGVEV